MLTDPRSVQTIGGVTPGAARIALPESVVSPSECKFGINIESPMDSGSKPTRSKTTSVGGDDYPTAKGGVPSVRALILYLYVVTYYHPDSLPRCVPGPIAK